ncbi:hypothetical protein JQC91_14415 [Jannaschia sp. Os4]|uniref:hypothetical protein n=1 Tax=Jannaschia sp. Os4 TaxID=2807617 RepID=UPI001939B8CE|nr:hypothetical protein [Jannaschia sp. Os4]MBM2577498.1 hypothetical protein [Jannaschia sp. Os4]
MTDPRAAMAARNNADLYTPVFAAHGVPFRRGDALFEAGARPPPLFSDVTTLRPGAPGAAEAVAAAMARAGGRGAVKDSFRDLEPPGMAVLFEATWIWRTPRSAPTRWTRATDPSALAAWEAGWAADAPQPIRQFPDALLADPRAVFLGRWVDGICVEGALATPSADCVGLSNAFGAAPGAFARAADAVGGVRPSLPVVGYERGAALDAARAAGFDATGGLRVWVGTGPFRAG